jgi:hypothetical protein
VWAVTGNTCGVLELLRHALFSLVAALCVAMAEGTLLELDWIEPAAVIQGEKPHARLHKFVADNFCGFFFFFFKIFFASHFPSQQSLVWVDDR